MFCNRSFLYDLGVGSEFGQLVNIVPGTFDWYDVAAYVGGYVLALIVLYWKKFMLK